MNTNANTNGIARNTETIHNNAIAFQTDESGRMSTRVNIKMPAGLQLTRSTINLFLGSLLNSLFNQIAVAAKYGVKTFDSARPVYIAMRGQEIEYNSANEHPVVHAKYKFSQSADIFSAAPSQKRFAQLVFGLFMESLKIVQEKKYDTLEGELLAAEAAAAETRKAATEEKKERAAVEAIAAKSLSIRFELEEGTNTEDEGKQTEFVAEDETEFSTNNVHS